MSSQLRCNSCLSWCHLRTCSGLSHHREWSENFVAPCRQQQHSDASSSSSYATLPSSPTQSPQIQKQQQQQQQQPHQSPLTPVIAVRTPEVISILQFNCNGLQVVVAAVQETKLTTNSSLHCCNGYNVLRKDRTRSNGGGIAFIIHNTVQYRALSLDLTSRDQYLEIQGIAVRSGDVDLELYNVYIPPVASCRTGYRPDIRSILDGNIRLVLGDFNAHHQLWHSRLGDDQRGALLAEQIDESTFCTLNDDAPTRIMGTCASSPDITLVSAGLINCTTWQTVVSLGSDQLPIIVSLERPYDFIVSERRTYMNQKKADWRGFREFTDRRFGELPVPSNVRIAERKFRETINAAVARFVPSVVRPHFPAEAARLAEERDDIRNTNPSDPRIAQLNSEISRCKRNKWLDHLSNCNLNTGVNKLWSTVRSLSNPKKKDDRVAIKFADKTISDPKDCS
ncbi:LOW QUALITY PROTEIN: uncharacterized protein ACRADG_012848 [Cochliomyia hominivorax]